MKINVKQIVLTLKQKIGFYTNKTKGIENKLTIKID
jgi:hypothetical protein